MDNNTNRTNCVRTNSSKAWLLATRPKTLSAAAVPVMIAVAMAVKDGESICHGSVSWVAAGLCLLFAWIMQIDSNLVNDYFDFKHGNDGEKRLGPKRACTEGWVTPAAMKRAIALTTLTGCAVGLPLVWFGGVEMVLVGICCVLFCFLYTTCLSYHGMGDLLVLLFFGIVPVCCTYYVVLAPGLQCVTPQVVALSVACGLAVDTLLVVNNYRDREGDRIDGKMTLVVRIGQRNAEYLYCALGNIAMIVVVAIVVTDSMAGRGNCIFLPLALVYFVLHNHTYVSMKKIGEGRELNRILGMTARNIFVFGLVTTAILCSLWIVV